MGYLQSKRRANFFNEWLERNMPSDPESSGKDLHNLSLISFGSFMASFPVMYLVCSHFFKSFDITRTILIQVSHIHSLPVWKFSEQVTLFFRLKADSQLCELFPGRSDHFDSIWFILISIKLDRVVCQEDYVKIKPLSKNLWVIWLIPTLPHFSTLKEGAASPDKDDDDEKLGSSASSPLPE